MKVLLIDGQSTTRLGIRVLLERTGRAEVVGEATNADGVRYLADELCPDLVVLDLDLGGRTPALQACRELKSLPRPPRVLVCTARNSREDVAAACLAGADSYLHKGVESDKLVEAINGTSLGQRVWLLGPTEEGVEVRLRALINSTRLTAKEREVLSLVVDHRTNREIAGELHLSRNTVKTHLRNIWRKLGVRSRRELLFGTGPSSEG